jgi:membrane-bound lytic murein transglycosylase MltF
MVATATLLCLTGLLTPPISHLQQVNEEWRTHTASDPLQRVNEEWRTHSSESFQTATTTTLHVHLAQPPATTVWDGTVEQWRPLTTAYFGGDADRALCLMGYESAGDPGARNPSSGAAGLMQVMPFWASEYGVTYADLFDPETNLRVAKGIRDTQGWTAWSPYNRGLCR